MTCTRQTLFWLAFSIFASESSWAQQPRPFWLDQSVSYMRMAEKLLLPAEQGHADAQTRLAEMYERGLGVPQNFSKAIDLYRKAASNGYQPALVKLRSLGVNVFAEPPAQNKDTDKERKDNARPLTQIKINVVNMTSSRSSFDLWSHDRVILTRVMKQGPKTRRKPFMVVQRRVNRGLLLSTHNLRPGLKVTGTN